MFFVLVSNCCLCREILSEFMVKWRNVISMSQFYTIMTLRANNIDNLEAHDLTWSHFCCGSCCRLISYWIYASFTMVHLFVLRCTVFSDNSNRFGYVEQVLKVNFILLCVLMKWSKKYHAVVKIVDSKLIPITYIWPLTFLVWYNHFNKIGIFELVQWTLNNCGSYFLRFNFVNIKRSK